MICGTVPRGGGGRLGCSAKSPRRPRRRPPARARPFASFFLVSGRGPCGDAWGVTGHDSAPGRLAARPRGAGGGGIGGAKKNAAAPAAGPRAGSPFLIFLSGDWRGSLWGRPRGCGSLIRLERDWRNGGDRGGGRHKNARGMITKMPAASHLEKFFLLCDNNILNIARKK